MLGIGGSATTDGGAGLLRGLGADADRDEPRADLAGLDPATQRASTWRWPATSPIRSSGQTGAAAVYGPQKGASAADVVELDRRLAGFADALEASAGRRVRDMPGAGAAGGVGFACSRSPTGFARSPSARASSC